MNGLTLNDSSSYITLREQVLVFIHSLWLLITKRGLWSIIYQKFQGFPFGKYQKGAMFLESSCLEDQQNRFDQQPTFHKRQGEKRKAKKTECTAREKTAPINTGTEGNFTIKRLMENACILREDTSESTISRFLNREGYYYLQARKKGLLKKIDLKNRRIFARKMKNEYPRHVWTHDVAFYLDGTAFAYKRNPLDQALAPKARVWWRRSEGLALGCTAKGRKTGTGGSNGKINGGCQF